MEWKTFTSLQSTHAHQTIPPGTIWMTARSTADDGWLLCLRGDSEVLLANGDSARIKDIVQGRERAEVTCVDSTGLLSVGNVSGWYEAPIDRTDWLVLKVFLGGGSGPRTLVLTRNHPVMTQRGWVRADSVTEKDVVFRYMQRLSASGEQVVYGSYLGDSSVSASGRWSHACGEPNKKYADWVSSGFGVVTSQAVNNSGWGAGRKMFQTRVSLKTCAPELLPHLRHPKRITAEFLDKLTWEGIAIWYADDGCLQRDNRSAYMRAQFHTEGFDEQELELISKWMRHSFGLDNRIYKRNNTRGKMLALTAESSRILWRSISRWMPQPMSYKIPEGYGEHRSVSSCEFIESGLVPLRVETHTLRPPSYRTGDSLRYDITVDGGANFFANQLLVHNCNGAAVSRTSYAGLYSAIGTTFGAGDGTTTFNVPTLNTRFPLGTEDGVTALGTLGTAAINGAGAASVPFLALNFQIKI